MQLALIFLVASLFGGKSFEQIKPIVRQLGGEEANAALKQAEELSSMLSGALSFSETQNADIERHEENFVQVDEGAPLAAVEGIANEQIICALSRYVATGE